MELAVNLLRELAKNRHACNIMSATRGPDLPNTVPLKYLFTARIRFLAFGSSNYFWAVRPTPEVDYEMVQDALTLNYDGLSHYLSHVSAALDSLFRLGLMDAREYRFLLHLASALKALVHIDEGMYSEKDIIERTGEVIKLVEELLSEHEEFIADEEVL